MIKYLIISAFVAAGFPWKSGLYSIKVISITGDTISMASFEGKRIVVCAFNGANADRNLLTRLDSLRRSDTSVVIIGVPANDLGGQANETQLKSMQGALALKIFLLKPGQVKKNAQEIQNPLVRWLTDVNANMHFARDADISGLWFFISKSGVLYSILGPDISSDEITKVLLQDVQWEIRNK